MSDETYETWKEASQGTQEVKDNNNIETLAEAEAAVKAAHDKVKKVKPVKSKASDIQIGGDHYLKFHIHPSEFIYRNNLNWLVGNAIKYLCRHEDKGCEQDLDKAKHYIDLLKEWRYGAK